MNACTIQIFEPWEDLLKKNYWVVKEQLDSKKKISSLLKLNNMREKN